MAEPTIAEAISLLTKVSADTANQLKILQKEVGKGARASTTSRGSTAPREAQGPRDIVEKPKDVVITNFGPDAEDDLARAFGRETEAALEKQQEKNNSDLMGLLKLVGVGAGLAALVDGQGIVGLVSGLQQVYKRIDKFAVRAGNVLSRIGTRISDLAKSIRKGVTSRLDKASKAVSKAIAPMRKKVMEMAARIGNRLSSAATSAKKGIEKAGTKVKEIVNTISTKFGGAFERIASRISKFGSSLVKGMEAAKKKAAEIARKITGSPAGKAVSQAASATKGFFSGAASYVGSKVSSAAARGAQAVRGGAQAVGRAGAAVGGAVRSGATRALKFTKDTVLKPVGAAIQKVKPLKLVRGLLKSPLLAPILESFFTYKDVEELVKQHELGDIDDAELNEKVGTRLIKAVTGVIGGAGGAILGGAIGSGVPIAGNIVGAIAGGVLGDVGGRLLGGLIAKKLGDKTSTLGEWALNSKLFKGLRQPIIGEPLAQVDDGIIFSQDGRVLAQANPMDTIYAMKEGGPLLTTLAAGFESNGKILINLHEMHADHMATQIELDEERNTLLLDLGKLLFSTLTPSEGGRTTPGYAGTSDFTGMSVADMRATSTGPMV